ncbi:MAG: YwaF family protein [Oscillospiraceae bacterium]|nr:YwaF family protein [Oscillospiraceae bacterium]
MLLYGSPFYICSLVLMLVLAGLSWFLLRKRSQRFQRIAILSIMLLNVFQHFFKALIYPQYAGQGFTSISSAYNMCAVLIMFSPVAFLMKNRFLKNFFYYVGSIAGIAAVAVPVWYIGKEIPDLGWDYFRFYICHAGLFVTSLLPLLLGLHKPSYKEFWTVGIAFLLSLCLILFNDLIFMTLGLYEGADIHDFYGSMLKINPCGLMAPPEALPWIEGLVGLFSPSFLMGQNPAGLYVPILWYAIPLYLGVSFIAFVLFTLSDWKQFKADICKLLKK